jgi:hypothetical protein
MVAGMRLVELLASQTSGELLAVTALSFQPDAVAWPH